MNVNRVFDRQTTLAAVCLDDMTLLGQTPDGATIGVVMELLANKVIPALDSRAHFHIDRDAPGDSKRAREWAALRDDAIARLGAILLGTWDW